MCRVILPSKDCLAVIYFSTLSHKRHKFRKKKLLNIRYLLWFPLRILSENFLIPRIIQQGITINVQTYSWNIAVVLVTIQRDVNFPRQIFGNNWNIKFHKNLSSRRRVVPCGWTDGQTDAAYSRFSQFCRRVQNGKGGGLGFGRIPTWNQTRFDNFFLEYGLTRWKGAIYI